MLLKPKGIVRTPLLLATVALVVHACERLSEAPTSLSVVEVINLQRPALVGPKNGRIVTTISGLISLRWRKVVHATGYETEVSHDPQLHNLVYTIQSDTNAVLVAIERGRTYYWRTRSTIRPHFNSEWSETWTFRVLAEGTTDPN